MFFVSVYFFFLGGASFLGASLAAGFCDLPATGGVSGASWTAFRSSTVEAATAAKIAGDAGVCGGVGDVTVVVGCSAAGVSGGIVTVGLLLSLPPSATLPSSFALIFSAPSSII